MNNFPLNNVRYYHPEIYNWKIANFQRITIAYERTKEGVIFAWSECSPNDRFQKSTGRSIANHRLAAFNNSSNVSQLAEFIDGTKHTGYLSGDFLLNALVGDILTPHYIQNNGISILDLKHKAITEYLTKYISDVVF